MTVERTAEQPLDDDPLGVVLQQLVTKGIQKLGPSLKINTPPPWADPLRPRRLRSLWLHRDRSAAALLAGLGFSWAIIQPVSFFFDIVERNRTVVLLVTIIATVGLAVRAAVAEAGMTLWLGATRVEVGFGDLFETPGVRIVAVNDFFDGQVGDHVAASSLHGQLIEREFSNGNDFRDKVSIALSSTEGVEESRSTGRRTRYPVGTTAVVAPNGNRYVLVALGATDITTLKVTADIKDLTLALESAWTAARAASGGEPVVMPLVGGGLSAVGMPPQQLVTLVLATLAESNGKQRVAEIVRLVLPVGLFDEIDLRALRKTM